jgi:hypothetical protein
MIIRFSCEYSWGQEKYSMFLCKKPAALHYTIETSRRVKVLHRCSEHPMDYDYVSQISYEESIVFEVMES